MFLVDQPYTLSLLVSIFILVLLTIIVLKQRPNLGTRAFAVMMTGVCLCACASLISVMATDPQIKIYSYTIKFLFIVTIPLAWIAFSLYYANRTQELPIVTLALLALPQLATLILVATNAKHHWVITSFEMVTVANHYLPYPHFGPWFWVHTAYCYLLLVVGYLLLAKHLWDSPAHYRRPVISLIVGGTAPWVANIFFIFKIGPLTYFDLTPIAFSITGVAFMWGILRYRLLHIVPIARDLLIQNLRDGVVVVDTHEQILDVNPAAARFIGRNPQEMVGACATDIIPWWHKLNKTDVDKDDITLPLIELEIDHATRLLRPLQTPLHTKDKPVGFLITLRDVTDTIQAQKALRHSEERFKSFSENAPVVIFALDLKGAITYVNRAWEQVLGSRAEDVHNKLLVDFVVPEDRTSMTQTIGDLLKGERPETEFNVHLQPLTEKVRLFNISVTVHTDAEGTLLGILGLAKDITEERRLQDQLIQSQKMEAIGTLAGGVAHDFNNLLMGMQANISLIRQEISAESPAVDKLNRIDDQIQNGATLTRQMLGYARKGKYRVETLDINPMIEDALHVVKRANKNIAVQSDLTKRPAYITVDKGQFELILLNLFINAVDAMPNGGTLSVTAGIISRVDLKQRWPDAANEGTRVELTISDTGMGMDDATRDRIFEPFFTTKERGHGTGLGLASVYGMVQNHDGHIQVTSKLGDGTAFHLLFPALGKMQKSECQKNRPVVRAQNDATILLVEDEALILKYCHEMIQSLGYEVVSAQSGRMAVDLFKARVHDIDLVVLDMIMPEMDGWQTYRALQELKPDIKVIVTSGYADDGRIDAIVSQGKNSNLKKPYTRDELSDTIATILHQTDKPICHSETL